MTIGYAEGPVRVDVPASSANLGPGFDSLGLALELRDELSAEVLASGLEVEVHGAGADSLALDETHLVVRALRAAFDELGGQPGGLRLVCHNSIPHARGLGSSSAAIVAGIHLARALSGRGEELMTELRAFRLAAEIEGHPDNVAAASFGGLTVSGRDDDDAFFSVRADVAAGIRGVVFVPPTPLETSVARGLLPDVVPHAEAAANAGRAALLMAALAGEPSLLLAATRDWLHQDYRRPAMPESLDLVDRLRTAGLAATVSGAGPAVLVLTDATDVADLLGHAPDGWESQVLDVASSGVRTR